MSPRKLLVLTAVVLLLFGFIVLFERKMPTTADRERKGDLIWELPEGRIESIRLENGGASGAGGTVELQNANGTWRMVKPDAYPADATTVTDLVSQLASLKRAGADIPGGHPEEYGLTATSPKVTLTWKDEGNDKRKLSRTLAIGRDLPGTEATAAQSGGDVIVLVPNGVANAIRKSADDFRSKEVFASSAFDAARLEVERGRGRLTLARKNTVWWISQPVNDLADADAVQRLLSDLTGLKVLSFLPAAERQDLASLGLAPALYRVTMAAEKGSPTTVEFGSTKSDGNSVYARREGQVFTVSSSITEELSKEAVGFRETRLVRFDGPTVTSLAAHIGDQSYLLEHSADGWKSGGKPIESAPAEALVSSILELKSRSFLDDDRGVKVHPAATVTVKAPAADWTITFSTAKPSPQAAVAGRPGAFSLAEDPVSELRGSLEKATNAFKPTPLPTAPPTKAPAPKK